MRDSVTVISLANWVREGGVGTGGGPASRPWISEKSIYTLSLLAQKQPDSSEHDCRNRQDIVTGSGSWSLWSLRLVLFPGDEHFADRRRCPDPAPQRVLPVTARRLNPPFNCDHAPQSNPTADKNPRPPFHQEYKSDDCEFFRHGLSQAMSMFSGLGAVCIFILPTGFAR